MHTMPTCHLRLAIRVLGSVSVQTVGFKVEGFRLPASFLPRQCCLSCSHLYMHIHTQLHPAHSHILTSWDRPRAAVPYTCISYILGQAQSGGAICIIYIHIFHTFSLSHLVTSWDRPRAAVPSDPRSHMSGNTQVVPITMSACVLCVCCDEKVLSQCDMYILTKTKLNHKLNQQLN